MTANQTIIGDWYVVEHQWRFEGDWLHESFFQPREWEIIFHPNGRMFEEFCPAGQPSRHRAGSWARDPASGVVSYIFDREAEFGDDTTVIFDPSEDGPWLYFFDDNLHIRPDRQTIIAHHAAERHKLQPVP